MDRLTTPRAVEDLLRELAPQVLGAVARHRGDFDTAEDAVQEALLAAAVQWPADGVPANPKGWLITAATAEPALAGHHRVDAVRAHLLDLVGDRDGARRHYRLAARRTLSGPEQRYLEARAARLDPG